MRRQLRLIAFVTIIIAAVAGSVVTGSDPPTTAAERAHAAESGRSARHAGPTGISQPKVPAMITLPPTLRRQAARMSAGILLDIDGGNVLWQKNADAPVPMASMSKMMTALIAVERIKAREYLALETPTTVSRAAAAIGGSQVWLAPGEVFTLGELLQATLVKSANDAAHAVAEAVVPDGNIRSFVTLMNRRARALGMPRGRFHNVHGLPGGKPALDNRASCREMSRLALELLKHPEARNWCKTRVAVFRDGSEHAVEMRNPNRLLSRCEGVNGIKTGYTRRAGYCVVATCVRHNRMLMAVVTGFRTKNDRERFVADLLDCGYESVRQ